MLSKLGLPLSPRISAHIVVAVCVIVIVVNLLEAIQLAYLWTALKWEPETEWDEWRMNGVRVAVGLVCGYLLWTCCAALVGLVGALRHNPSYLRFFRDCTIVDLVFSFMFTIITAFAASRPSTRALLCEQLSRQPELLRGIANSGLNFENCELWFENAVVAFVCVMFITLVMRVQFTFTLSNFYTRILRKKRQETFDYYYPPRRILLLPTTEDIPLAASATETGNDVDNVEASRASSSASPLEGAGVRKEHVLVYAPVRHTIESAHRMGATEAWVSSHRHGHSRSRSRTTGQIQLEIQDGEGLLPDALLQPLPPRLTPHTSTPAKSSSSSLPRRSSAFDLKSQSHMARDEDEHRQDRKRPPRKK